MTKHNSEIRSTLLQRVDHLETAIGVLYEWKIETQAVIEREQAKVKADHRRLTDLLEDLNACRNRLNGHCDMTFSQRLRWLLRGQR